jgi:N-acetylglutamate synthase-like GNAT family acetyltransferase
VWGEIIEKHLTLRRADPNQAATLTALAIRSKAFWGYSADFMEACRAELLVSQDNIQDSKNQYVIAESAGEVLGFYALERLSASEFELDALFVEPLHIGTGVGRRLIRHAIQAVAGAGGRELFIQGDPNAEKFYCAAGGKLIGTRESASIPGRSLPLFAISIAELSREWGG